MGQGALHPDLFHDFGPAGITVERLIAIATPLSNCGTLFPQDSKGEIP
ncbi:hypothetical protein PSE_2715 [Pseudovibrio sp. FO-BEG1]|nr:hypothetical protein PSE_2715 [Pseudovibrio sp. FO-BEG1]EEA92705.1 hypothetical protein PJE062_4209 [Pseudovibrio sp. JE062]